MTGLCRKARQRAAVLWPPVMSAASAMLAAILCAGAAQAQETDSRTPAMPMHEQVLTMPGDPARPVSLEVTLFTPPGDGPFPLAVMNHGATGASASNRGERYRFTVSAYYFLSRGYAVALPMARGFAGSGGDLIHLGCDLAGVAEGNARDIRAVIGALEQRPDIDRTRVVVAGQSFGAWNTLGIGTERGPAWRRADEHRQSRDARNHAAAAGYQPAQASQPG